MSANLRDLHYQVTFCFLRNNLFLTQYDKENFEQLITHAWKLKVCCFKVEIALVFYNFEF